MTTLKQATETPTNFTWSSWKANEGAWRNGKGIRESRNHAKGTLVAPKKNSRMETIICSSSPPNQVGEA